MFLCTTYFSVERWYSETQENIIEITEPLEKSDFEASEFDFLINLLM